VADWILSAAHTIARVSSRSSRRPTERGAAPGPPAPAQNDAADTSSLSALTLAGALYELQITLLESQPAIWCRVQVPGKITLLKLHQALQVLMGWQDYHLHQFAVNGALYGRRVGDWQDATPELREERGVRLYHLAPVIGTRLVYEYDFGDGWQLEILVERISVAQEGAGQVVCLDGRRAGPPEDVGGIGGYAEFLQAIRNRRHPEHRSWLDWVGGRFDPDKFDRAALNQTLQRIR
jgi:hypothetical protein